MITAAGVLLLTELLPGRLWWVRWAVLPLCAIAHICWVRGGFLHDHPELQVLPSLPC